MIELKVIIASTRPNRLGPTVAAWFYGLAAAHAGLHSELIDLAEVGLPLFDEPQHPSKGNYAHEHTRRWSARIATADAIAVVMPEYNHLPPPSLVNAFDFIYQEWNYKPVGFVSYGGISGGTRAVEVARQQAVALKMTPITASVPLPFAVKQLEGGRFVASESQNRAAAALLDELAKMGAALRPLRS